MWSGKADDLEYGALYPGMVESPELRWGFIRKVYSIVSVQLLLTIAVSAVVMKATPILAFFTTTGVGFGLYIFLLLFPLIVLCPLYCYRQSHPVNYILLAIYTVTISFAVGLSCAFYNAVVVIEAAVLTAAIVIGLTLYTFWAAKRGHDFSFLGPFLSCSLGILVLFGFIQIFFPMGKISTMIYGALGAIIFSGYIIFDTDNLIKRFTYDEYIWASVILYIDVINLFLYILQLLNASES